MVQEDGTMIERSRGTPQGGVITGSGWLRDGLKSRMLVRRLRIHLDSFEHGFDAAGFPSHWRRCFPARLSQRSATPTGNVG